MSFKKRGSSKWTDTPNYIHKTDVDTITTLPANIYPTGTTATVGLKGQMEQNGTPTPQNPIQPSECGDLETVGVKAGQYKIPISSNSTTTNVYLGGVQSERLIYKYVFKGNETIAQMGETHIYYYTPYGDRTMMTYSTIVCSHYIYHNGTATDAPDNSVFSKAGAGRSIWIRSDTHTDATAFKVYLADQYAAGTPVTIWYVLATPTTGIVNEPLRKIGDYADTVSGITIPTITGANTIDVDTTLKPSEVSVNYKGWHSIQSLHGFNGTSWD